MYNFDPYDVLLSIAINKSGFVLQGHVFKACVSINTHQSDSDQSGFCRCGFVYLTLVSVLNPV